MLGLGEICRVVVVFSLSLPLSCWRKTGYEGEGYSVLGHERAMKIWRRGRGELGDIRGRLDGEE